MCQLFLPLKQVDRRDESPRLKSCLKSKKRFEEFIAYNFNVISGTPAYHHVFPFLDIATDLDTVPASTLQSLSYVYDGLYKALEIDIWMCRNWETLDDEERWDALQYWLEQTDGDILCYIAQLENHEEK